MRGGRDSTCLGPCCCCGGTNNVRNIYWLHKKAPVAGKGWGCVVCNLPMDGAIAVLCDRCHDLVVAKKLAVKMAVAGYPAEGGRVPIEELVGTHDHDMARHAAYEAMMRNIHG